MTGGLGSPGHIMRGAGSGITYAGARVQTGLYIRFTEKGEKQNEDSGNYMPS